MNKRIVSLVYILILALTNYAAAASSELPPPLPVIEDSEREKSETDSLWNKVLNFLGFNKETKNDQITSSGNQITSKESVSSAKEEPKPLTASSELGDIEKTESITNNNLPAREELSNNSEPQQNSSDVSDLKLPEGITPDDDIVSKEADNIDSEKETSDKNNFSSIPELQTPSSEAEKPEQDIALSLPTDKTIKTEDQKEATQSTNLKPSEQEINKTDNIIQLNAEKESLPSPAEANQNNEAANVKIYRQHLQERLNAPKQLPQLSEKDFNENPVNGVDAAKLKFINDEAQVLLLPNDEVVLGEVTRESQLELMDFSSYLKVFWDNYNNIKDEPAKLAINNFISNYDNNFNKQRPYNEQQLADALMEAYKAIDKNSIYNLTNLIDAYPILQITDCEGNSLLHKSVYKNNYSAAKFLIMKGINISLRNNKNLTALDIAIAQKKNNIANLLISAGAK